MEWTDETIVRLRDLWTEGHSTAEIGRRLNVSKNAVVGKAHRLNLPARPSPIRRDGPSAPAAAAPTNPLTPQAGDVPPAPPPRPVGLPSGGGRRVACCWPIGEPGTRSFRFCDADATHCKPYCSEHAQLAYVRVRDRREDAA